VFDIPGAVVRELASALDALGADELHGLSEEQLLDRVRELVAVRNRVAAELARTVRRAELAQAPERDGLRSMASWLRGHCRLSPSAAGALVRAGRTLERLPAVPAGCAAGAVTAEQVAVLAPVVRPEQLARAAEQDVDPAAIDATLAEVAATGPHPELARVVHHHLARPDQDGPEPDPTGGRALRIARHADGGLAGRCDLDAVGGEKVQAALESLVQAHRPAGDERSRARRLADALVQLCDNALAAGDLPVLRRVKPQVALTVGLGELADPAVGPGAAQTGFGATLSAARARWIACDADLTRIVLGPDGQPLDLGRTVRLVPPHLRRAVVARDRHRVFAGCGAPHHWCEVHHLLEWIFGGETGLANSGLLCERHHTKVHHGFRVERDTAGRWHTYRPDGTEILLGEPLLTAA
jgi:Domain of unknown function (DUF222)